MSAIRSQKIADLRERISSIEGERLRKGPEQEQSEIVR